MCNVYNNEPNENESRCFGSSAATNICDIAGFDVEFVISLSATVKNGQEWLAKFEWGTTVPRKKAMLAP